MGGAGQTVVILADVSRSMAEKVGRQGRVDVLQAALDEVHRASPAAIVIAYANLPELCSGPLPSPSGGTALHLALDRAGAERPRQVIVITDGEPDDEEAALVAADRTSGLIDVIYCGDDSSRQAIDFCRRLARRGGGRYARHDMRCDGAARLVAREILLLTGPPA